MENDNSNYSFLTSDRAKRYFADADIALKQGRHLQDYGYDSRLFSFVDEYYDRGLKEYYQQLFQMNLVREKNDNQSYYYLDFPDDGKGKLGKENRSKELEDEKVIFAILLLNVFKDKFFEQKEMEWSELEQIFKESEHKELWQKLLYGKVKLNYTPDEEQKVKERVKSILKDFEKLGWVIIKNTEEIKFEIMPSIERISRLYKDAIGQVDSIQVFLNDGQLS
jgi:hypothetical protein